jgi:protein PsiE
MDPWKIIGISASTLILAATVLVIRWGHLKLPYDEHRGGN